MSEKLSFDEWWADFSHNFRNDKDGGHAMLDRLIFDVGTFTQEKRIAFIDELLQRKNLEMFACKLIPMFGDKGQIAEIKKRANELVKSNITDQILPDYFDVIFKTYKPEDLQLLKMYYLNYQDEIFFRIPTALFEVDRNLFLQAFTKYLPNYSVESICNYDGFLYLTNKVEAIEFLITNLPDVLSLKMRFFAKAKSKHSMVIRDKVLSEKLLKLIEL